MSKVEPTKYHISKKGTIAVCEAEERACQYGASEHLTPEAVTRIQEGNPVGEKETAIWFNQQTIKEEISVEEEEEEEETLNFVPEDLNKENNMNRIKTLFVQSGIPENKHHRKLVTSVYARVMEENVDFDDKVENVSKQIRNLMAVSKPEASDVALRICTYLEKPNRTFDVNQFVRDGQKYTTLIHKASNNMLTVKQAEELDEVIELATPYTNRITDEDRIGPIYGYLVNNAGMDKAVARRLAKKILKHTKIDYTILDEIDIEYWASEARKNS